MEKAVYLETFKAEDRHWWFTGMRRICLALLRQAGARLEGSLLLDCGCGTGGLLAYLSCQKTKALGVDISSDALGRCQERGLSRLVRADLQDLPFKKEVFDIIVCLDVLYHRWVRDDQEIVRQMYVLLKKGGFLLIREPAFSFLRGKHDEKVYTRHRYERREFFRLLCRAGFRPLRLTYVNSMLFLPMCIFRIVSRDRLKRLFSSDASDISFALSPLANAVLKGILYLEGYVLRFVNLPVGSSLLCVARK